MGTWRWGCDLGGRNSWVNRPATTTWDFYNDPGGGFQPPEGERPLALLLPLPPLGPSDLIGILG